MTPPPPPRKTQVTIPQREEGARVVRNHQMCS